MQDSSLPRNPATQPADSPRIWVVLGEKQGDNGQVEVIEQALPWSCERKNVQMLPPFVLGKPKVAASLDHIDKARSDPLEPPWPDLILTIGRRPANVALWVQEQSGGRTKIVLVGKPSGMTEHFDLVIHSAEAQLPPLPNVLSITLPLMQVDERAVEAAARIWEPRLADLPRPLVAILVGGPTGPFIFDGSVSDRLTEIAAGILDQGGTPYITTSRRTPPQVVEHLQTRLPEEARLFAWTPDSEENPYRGLLGLADGFIVTGDSISMMVEVVRLQKPLAILGLPRSLLGAADQLRRSFSRWLFTPQTEESGPRHRHRLAVALFRSGLLTHTRDFLAFHQMLIDQGLAVRAGEAFRASQGRLPDDLPRVVSKIQALVG